METELSLSRLSSSEENETVNEIIQNLFELGLEEVLQKIFLYLDPKR